MALRTKTVEFAFPTSTTALASNTRLDFAAITLYLPENASRTFLSVVIEISHQCNDAAGGNNITSRTIGIKLGAVAFNDSALTEPIFEGFSTASYRWTRDVTSYFNTNFGSGASQTCQVGYIMNGQSSQSVTAKLYITYQFDDAAQTTRVKTVKIPLESPTGLLTNVLAEIGTNQVPNLSTLLPESSITYRSVWFEMSGNQDTNGATTDFNLAASLDAESEVNVSGTWEEGNNNYPNWFFLCWVRNDMTTNATHAFKARTSTTGRVSTLCVVLCVTYEYDHSASTTIMNSLMMYLPRVATFMSGSGTSSDAFRSQFKFMIQEPTTITLRQSAVLLSFNAWALQQGNVLLRCGSQNYRTYTYGTDFASNPPNGQFTIQQRIDSSGVQGAGITLSRGENTLTLDSYMSDTDSAQAPFNVDALVYLNYTSAKSSFGADAHAHTTRWMLRDSLRTPGSTQIHTVSATGPKIPEGNYWTVAVGAGFNNFMSGTSTGFLSAERGTGEGYGDGWQTLVASPGYNDENIVFMPFNDVSQFFTRHPFDPDSNRMHLDRTRRWRIGINSQTAGLDATDTIIDGWLLTTYSAMPLEVERSTTPAVNATEVGIYRSDTRERLYRAFTKADGDFTFICHTDSLTHFCEAQSSTTYSGRSFNFTPSGFDFSASWTPASLTPSLWLRADLGVTTAGGSVSAWSDQSGSSNNAAQGTGGNQPTNPLDVGDGLPGILFDGTNDQLDITDSAGFASTTTFSVATWARMAATFPTNGTIIGQWSSTATSQKFRMYVATGGNLVVEVTSGSSVSTATVATALSASTWYHLSFVYNGGGSGNTDRLKVYINAVQQTPTYTNSAVPSSVNNPTGVVTIGSSGVASTFFNGHVSEVVHVNGTALTQDQLTTLYFYRPRWG